MNTILKRLSVKTLLALTASLFASTALADDTEVYVNPSTVTVAPNIMFVLDLSDSMNKKPDGTEPAAGEDSRLTILKQAINDVLDSDLPAVNVGLSTFTKDRASGIKWPTLGIDDDASTYDANIPTGTTVADVIKGIVDDAVGTGFTPTVDQLYEVTRYFRGMSPAAPANHSFGTWNSARNAYTGGSSDPEGWRAVNPIAHTGGLPYVATTDPTRRYNARYCNDYSMRNPAGPNQCADELAEGLILTCETVPAVAPLTCTFNNCDSECGTYNRCETSTGGWAPLTYTEPANCLTRADGSTWVTNTSSGQPSRCCKTSDSGGTECTSHINYTPSCSAPNAYASRCRTWNGTAGSQAYQKCHTGQADTRQYISPITQQCQKSAIVLLTDGDPSINREDFGKLNSSNNAAWPYDIRNLIAQDRSAEAGTYISRNSVTCEDQSTYFGAAAWSQPYGNCGIELADHINTTDQVDTVIGSTIETHTIGFGLSGPVANETWGYLQRLATAGGGQSYQANDLDTLTESFRNVINSLTTGNQSFRNFSATFDVATLSTGNRAFLSMFGPTEYRTWDGNLKGYFLKPDGLYDVYDTPATELDTDGQVVFKPTAKSFWSNVVDGNTPQSGGLVSTLNPGTRNLYVLTDPTQTTNVDLNSGLYDLDVNNNTLNASVMGMPVGATSQQRDDLIAYTRSARMGDPLHTRSQIVSYGGTTGNVLFLATNQGFIHAVDINRPTNTGDTGGGTELFAFMPYESVGNLHAQEQNSTSGNHIYGVDGPVTVWRQDLNANGIIDGSDKVYLYFGMRRGGSAYYAMDVTDPTDPKVMWKIDASTPGFAKIGQSWSKMTLANLKEGAADRKVLIFGGGYDTQQDVIGVARPAAGDTVGMGIYVIDAESGSLHASLGPNNVDFSFAGNMADMKYSIPADVKVADTNADGIHDRLYFGDMGGQLWRVDIDQARNFTSNAKFKGYKLADFGQDSTGGPTAATNRRLYYTPSVARYTRAGSFVYAVSIGSGYRGHPLDDTISDHVFVFFDEDAPIGSPVTTPAPITLANLYDATPDLAGSGTTAEQTQAQQDIAAKKGWHIALAPKEKVLARTRIFRNRVLFTTFLPEGSGGVCDVSNTTNRLYVVNLDDATGAFPEDSNNDGVMDSFTRSQIVADQAMILDEPMIVTYHNPGDPEPEDEGTPPEPASTCAGVYGGAQRMLTICSAPVKVNWTTLQ